MTDDTKDRGFMSLESYAKEAQRILADVRECEACGHDGSERRLETHHLDEDPTHNVRDNLRKLCSRCHGAAHRGEVRICRVGPCDRPVQSRGMCNKHYMRWYQRRKFGHDPSIPLEPGEPAPDELPNPERAPAAVGCSADGCDAGHYARGFCYNHYMQDYRRRRTARFIG